MKHKSLRTTLMVTFSSILILVTVSNIVLNNLLLPKVYRNEKIATMNGLYQSIYEQYADNYDENAIIDTVKDVLLTENLRVFIWNNENRLVIDSQPLLRNDDENNYKQNFEKENETDRHDDAENSTEPYHGKIPAQDVRRVFSKNFMFARNELYVFYAPEDDIDIISKNEKYTIFSFTDFFENEHENIYLRGVLPGEYKLLIQMPYSSIDEAVRLSNTLLLIVGIAMLLLGIVVVAIISKTIAKPIVELSEIAKSMKKLDFSKQYVNSRHDEIGSLGDSINSLSSKLEQTINELYEKNEALRKDNELKSKIDTLRKEFIANASHELKTPVALISGYAEGLRDNIAADEKSKQLYTNVIIEETEKMDQIIRQMLDLMELDGSEEVIDGVEIYLCDLVEEAIHNFDLLIKSKEIKLEYVTEGNSVIYGDYMRIHQAVSNYISNAINHVDENKIIKVSVKELEDSVRLGVYNSGSGIPKEEEENIWERFYKVDKAHTREYGGTGLGLSIVKRIVKLHNGICGFENHPDGVEFYFILKRRKNNEN